MNPALNLAGSRGNRKAMRSISFSMVAVMTALLMAGSGAAYGQSAPADANAPAQPEPAAQEPVAYDSELSRLAQLLGALHYLRNLCGETGNTWRDQMETLLVADRAEGERRARLIAAFNDGYRGYALTYSTCNERAAEIAEEYRSESAELASTILVRYKN